MTQETKKDIAMQVTATLNEGLKREFRVVVPLADLATRAEARLEELKDRVQINGFRPGRVPKAHLKKLYGRSVLAEAIDAVINEANQKIINDNGFKLAMSPNIKLPDEKTSAEALFEGKADLDYTVDFEVLPTFEVADLRALALEKQVAEPAEDDVQAMLDTMAGQNRPYEAKSGPAEKDDRLTLSFVGKIDGVAFDGGTAEGIQLVLGSGSFIPGFEDQLIGLKTGDEKLVKVSFPEGYAAKELAGKPAEFDVKVTAVDAPGARALDDEFAKMVGFDTLDALKSAIRERLTAEYAGASRRKVKRSLLDALDAAHTFALPGNLVDQEFDIVFRQLQEDMATRAKTFEEDGTTEDKAREEYRKIAERRVRLGLVLAEIGEKAQIQITDEEVTRAVVDRARQFPGQEQQVWDYYRKNQQALASLRAPIFEEKVVDYVLELAKVAEKTVTKDELFKDDEGEAA